MNIIRKSDELYQVNINDVSTQDLTLKELFKVMKSLQVEVAEVELAVNELIWNDHTLANFGIMRRFVFTK